MKQKQQLRCCFIINNITITITTAAEAHRMKLTNQSRIKSRKERCHYQSDIFAIGRYIDNIDTQIDRQTDVFRDSRCRQRDGWTGGWMDGWMNVYALLVVSQQQTHSLTHPLTHSLCKSNNTVQYSTLVGNDAMETTVPTLTRLDSTRIDSTRERTEPN